MAMCEKCGKSGLDMRDMRSDPDKGVFVGPCCFKIDPMAFVDPSPVSYGVEFSSHMGIRAYVSYSGLTVEFKKTKKEIDEWMQIPTDSAPPTEEVIQETSNPAMN